jgi:hypothetical protein
MHLPVEGKRFFRIRRPIFQVIPSTNGGCHSLKNSLRARPAPGPKARRATVWSIFIPLCLRAFVMRKQKTTRSQSHEVFPHSSFTGGLPDRLESLSYGGLPSAVCGLSCGLPSIHSFVPLFVDGCPPRSTPSLQTDYRQKGRVSFHNVHSHRESNTAWHIPLRQSTCCGKAITAADESLAAVKHRVP